MKRNEGNDLKLFYFSYSEFKDNWKNAWSTLSFKVQVLITSVILLILIVFIEDFFYYIQHRPGYRINDFLLNRIRPYNMSLYIFLLIYSIVILSIINFSSYPIIFLKCMQAYSLLVIMRIFSLYLFPLEPDSSIILLRDPFVDRFFYNNVIITKDLFFSGHISTMFLLSLYVFNSQLKYFSIVITILTAVLMLIQHVHYTIDIIAAPMFAWVCYKLVSLIPLPIKK